MGCKKTLIVFIVLFGLCFSVYCGESPSYGGDRGTEFSDANVFADPNLAELKKITIKHGNVIDSIQCEWIVNGVVKRGEKHGGGGGPNVGSGGRGAHQSHYRAFRIADRSIDVPYESEPGVRAIRWYWRLVAG